MYVTGFFPVHWWLSGDLWIYKHGQTPGEHKFLKAVTGEEGKSMLTPTVEAAFARDANIFLKGSPPAAHYGPYNCTFAGAPKPNPPDKYFALDRLKVSTDFFLAKKEGRIAVSDTIVGQARSTYINGQKVTKETGENGYGARYSGQDFLFPQCNQYGSNRASRSGSVDYIYIFNIRYRKQTREIGVTPYEVGWTDDIVEDLLQLRPRSFTDEVYGTIMETTADANRGIIDFATSMAEMPEAIRMIYDLLKQILTIYHDARRKEFRIRNQAKGKPGSLEQSNAQWKKDRKEEADAVANLWLQTRYGIEPLSYMVEDLLDLLDKYANEFFRWRNTCTTTTPLGDLWLPPGWTCDKGQIESLGRAFIKRGIKLETLSQSLGNLASVQPLVTLWELGTLSFVVDWALNVGNLLSSLSSPSFNYEEGATFSWKCEDVVKFTHKESGASVLVDIRTYDRKVITPSDYCRLLWNPDLAGKRQIDALALSWNMFLRHLVK